MLARSKFILYPLSRSLSASLSNKSILSKESHEFLHKGRELWQNNEFSDAAASFDKVIDLFRHVKNEDISKEDRKLLVKLLCIKADVFKVGSSGDELIALACLERALELDPGSIEAQDIQRGIHVEYGISPNLLKR